MNALVASVIRTYTPIIVGQLAAWLILIHIPVEPSLTVLLTAIVGAVLSGAYYTLVRVLEQQWPWVGALLGLTASPDTYSKGDPTAKTAEILPAIVEQTFTTAPATTFPRIAVAAAAAAVAAAEPVTVAPVYEAPAAPVEPAA